MTLRRSTMRPTPPVDHRSEPGYSAWHKPVWGYCAACDEGLQRLERHHVFHEQHVRAVRPDLVWDLRNSLKLGAHCRCHSRHTTAAERLSASLIGDEARTFGIEVFGDGAMELYVARYYRTDAEALA